jgi:hypothetical protein
MFLQKPELLLLGFGVLDQFTKGLQTKALIRAGDLTGLFQLPASILACHAQQALENTSGLNAPTGHASHRPRMRFRADQLGSSEQPVDAAFASFERILSGLRPVAILSFTLA